MNKEELRALAISEGAPAFRGSQLAEWLYHGGARNFDEMSNLPTTFRDQLKAQYIIGRSRTVTAERSGDGTVKLLLELGDGARIETVGLVTFMGMGEPLLNYGATAKALRLLIEELGISARHLTVSTIGYVPGIRRLMVEKLPVTLAVSLHAPTDELRRRLIPGLTKWSVIEIVDACRDYVWHTGRRVTIEYCIIDNVNDSPAEARQLAALLKGLNCHVNVIPFNPVAGLPFKSASPPGVKSFVAALLSRGIQVTERRRRGADIDAACGQLRRRQGS